MNKCDGSAEFWHTNGDGSWWAVDARNIPMKRVCPKCFDAKLAGYRSEFLTDPNYSCDEPIEED